MAAEEVTAFLAKTSFFGGLTPEVVGVVAGMLKEKRVSTGEQLFAEGDTGKSMYIVREGALIMKRHCGDGTEARRWSRALSPAARRRIPFCTS